jgi:hypothetical protein
MHKHAVCLCVGGRLRPAPQERVVFDCLGSVVCLVNSAGFSDNDELFHVRGAMVQRLARGPFKAKIRVRFPLALPGFHKPTVLLLAHP